ncbi:MAG TPA: peptidase E [Tepidisphaeraceae bacterium]|nr:peptidase E [Tepidisphaeraceae bacterium]
MIQQIVGMGGGGFSMEPENRLLDDYILRLTKRRRPKICFLATACGDQQSDLDEFYRAFPKKRATASHLPLFFRYRNFDMTEHLLNQNVIYVGGGNTANMLAIWRLHGVDQILRRAWKSGVILCGLSAGMNCWFESCVTDSFGELRALNDGLGFLPGSVCPHYDGQKDRRPTYRRLIATKKLPAGYAADDGAGLHFIGRKLYKAISSRRNAKAYRVERFKGKVVEKNIGATFLG